MLYWLFWFQYQGAHGFVTWIRKFSGRDCAEFTFKYLVEYSSKTIWIWRFFWGGGGRFYITNSIYLIVLGYSNDHFWVDCGSLCFLRNSFILSIKFRCVELFIVFLYYPHLIYAKSVVIISCSISDVGSLCLLSLFNVSLATCLSILLIFLNQLFVSLVFFVIFLFSITWISALIFISFLQLVLPFFF